MDPQATFGLRALCRACHRTVTDPALGAPSSGGCWGAAKAFLRGEAFSLVGLEVRIAHAACAVAKLGAILRGLTLPE